MSDLRTSFFFPSFFLCHECWLPQIVGQLCSFADFLFLLSRKGCLLVQLFWGWGAFPPFVCVASCLLGLPLGTTAQPGEQVSFKAALPFSGGAGCHFWMASDVAQVKRDGTWHRAKAGTLGWVPFSSWLICCLELPFKTIKKKYLANFWTTLKAI